MAKITWTDRSDTATDGTRNISASIFNDTKTSVNAAYDIIEARLGTTSSADNVDLIISGTIYVSGSIIPNTDGVDTTSSFDLGSPTSAWSEIYVATSSLNFVDTDGTITKWSKSDIVNLKAGKSLSTVAGKQLVNENDDTTYVRMSTAGRATHYAGGNVTADFKSDKITLGGLAGSSTGLPVSMPGGFTASSGASITGSINITGSSVYTTTDLLTLLGNFGQTGSFAVTGSSEFTGDVNMDGVVTTQDLLQVVAGMNTTGSVNITGSTSITGSMEVLPPPLEVTDSPITETLYYGYNITGSDADPSGIKVFLNNENPNLITQFKFAANSQPSYSYLVPPTPQNSFFSGLIDSASGFNTPTLTFTPSGSFPTPFTASYKFEIDSVINSSSEGYYHVNVTFVGSSSIYSFPNTAPSTISPTESFMDNRFEFFIPPQTPPTGGFVVGDLLNVLANYGNAGVDIGELGDYTFDGAVNLNDLLFVLSGYGNPNTLCQDIYVPSNTNHQLIGPVISICEGNFLVIQTGSYCSITL